MNLKRETQAISIEVKEIPKRGKCYYKAGQLLQSGAVFIANWDMHYKTGQPLLEIGGIITKQGTTVVSVVIHHTDGLTITPNYLFKC